MGSVEYINVAARAIEPMVELYGAAEMQTVQQAVDRLSRRLHGGVVWNVNSTAHGGGVAELLHSLVGYARGAGIDCRWAAISGPAEFFLLTKRLHNAMHGADGD